MKILFILAVLVSSGMAQANEAATVCEASARLAASGFVQATGQSLVLKMTVGKMTYSSGTLYRFDVPTGNEHLGSYEVQVDINESGCLPTAVTWNLSPI